MKHRREIDLEFWIYLAALVLLFIFPFVAWALVQLNVFQKYIFLFLAAVLVLFYEFTHTIDPK